MSRLSVSVAVRVLRFRLPRFFGPLELGNQIKGFTVFESQLPVLPRACAQDKSQQLPLLRRRLLLEKIRCPVGQIQQPRAVLDVVLVRLAVPLDLVGQLDLLGPALIRFAPEEGLVDYSVELVVVHGVKASLDFRVFSLEPCDGLLVVPPLVGVALPQRLFHPGKNLVVELEPMECSGELPLQDLFADVRLRALALIARAVVIDVALLLEFPHHTAATVATRNDSGEGEIVLLLLPPSAKPLGYDLLGLLPQLPRNDRLVSAPVHLAVEIEVPRVDAVMQNLVYGRFRNRIPAFPEDHAGRLGFLGDLGQGVFAGSVPLEYLPDYGRELWVRLNGPFPVCSVHVNVPQRGIGRPDPLLRFLQHALTGFLGQVVNIILGHQDLDTVDELLRRSGFGREHAVFLDEVDLDVQAVDCDPIFKISVKPVRFFDQDDPRTRITPQKRDHLAEAGSTTPFGRFHIGEFLGDVDRILGCVVSK